MSEKLRPQSETFIKQKAEQFKSEHGVDFLDGGEDVFSMSLSEIREKYRDRWDKFIYLLRAERNGKDVNELEVERMKEWIHALNRLKKYIDTHKENGNDESGFEFRGRQATVFEDIYNALEQGTKLGYVKLPTGSGKTVLFAKLMEAMNLKSLIIVPRKILVDQTDDELDTHAPDIEHGTYKGDIKVFTDTVTVVTYQSLINLVKTDKIKPEDYQLLILDEQHNSAGKETSKAIEAFDGIKIGFSATPRDGTTLGDEIHTMKIKEAIKESMLCGVGVVLVKTDTDLSSVKVTGDGYNQGELESVVNTHGRNKAAVEIYKQGEFYGKKLAGKRTIAYCGGVTHAQDLAKMFVDNGVRAVAIHGKTPKDEQKRILKQFHNGEIDVVCNAKLLIEGYSEDLVEVVLNLHPTLSTIDVEQRGGRALRLNESDPHKEAVIIDFLDKNAKRMPVLFSEVLEAVHIAPASSGGNAKKKEGESVELEPKPEIDIEGVEIVIDEDEIIRVVSESGEQEKNGTIKSVPDGWMNLTDTRKSIKCGIDLVRIEADKYRKEHPDFFMDCTINSRQVEYYSPELIQILQEKLRKAPDGWMTAQKLKIKFGSAVRTIKRDVEEFREEHSEWFFQYKSSKRTIEYYSPELVKKLYEVLPKKAPDGWVTVRQLSIMLGSDKKTIKTIFDDVKDVDSDDILVCKTGSNLAEHYSPELIEKIKEELETRRKK